MEVNLEIQGLKSCALTRESSMSSHPNTHQNKMVLLREKIEP